MFKEENQKKSSKNDLEEKVPEDPFKGEDLVIYNALQRFGDDNDQLMKINFRRYGVVKVGSTEKEWYYAGFLFEMKKVKSKGVSKIPYESHLIYDVSEGNLITRRELLSY